MNYRRLDYLRRCKIQAFSRAGYTQQQIADEIGVHKSTICRELNRNITFVRTRLGYLTYKADNRQKEKPKDIKVSEPIKTFITAKLKQEWSPEQISGYAKNEQLFNLSHEWIYQFILCDKNRGGSLFKHLRHQSKAPRTY